MGKAEAWSVGVRRLGVITFDRVEGMAVRRFEKRLRHGALEQEQWNQVCQLLNVQM